MIDKAKDAEAKMAPPAIPDSTFKPGGWYTFPTHGPD